MQSEVPSNEAARLTALQEYQILDTPPEPTYDDITRLASQICGTPISLVTLLDQNRQWFKSNVGLEGILQTPRDIAFCARAILEPDEITIVPDAKRDARFAAHPLVVGEPRIRFYAGAPLVTPNGEALGTLCVLDKQPRQLTQEQQESLRALANLVMTQMELRRLILDQERVHEELRDANARLQQMVGSDNVTGLLSRRSAEARLREEAARAERHKRPLSLVLMNVDDFHQYNDAYGHAAGDEVLRSIAEILKAKARGVDVLARMGGDEFLIILPETDSAGALMVAERCRGAIAHANWPNWRVTVSVGVVSSGAHPNAAELLDEADTRVYQSKQRGRNQITHG
jgi:diguanylate cyclase (GGDEF)-like protein